MDGGTLTPQDPQVQGRAGASWTWVAWVLSESLGAFEEKQMKLTVWWPECPG